MRRIALTALAVIVALTVTAPVAQAAPPRDYQPPPVAWVGYSAGVSAALLVVALAVFKRLEPYFAENI